MSSTSLFAELLKVLGFMGFLIAGCLLLVKSWGQRGRPKRAGKSLSVTETVSLGGNKLLCLVRAGRSNILVGVTDQHISLLKEMAPEDLVSGNHPNGPALDGQEIAEPAENPSFSSFLINEAKKAKRRLTGKETLFALALFAGACSWLFAASTCVAAPAELPIPNVNINVGGQAAPGGLGTSLGILGLLTVLSLAPAIVMLTTSFTRMVIVFSFLRSGLGTQQTPPNQVLVGLALILTFFVMTPTWSAVYNNALQPYIAGSITGQKAFALASEPMKDFMLRETREKDLALFATLGGREAPATPKEMSLVQVVPAFVISELRTAFEMGFLLYLPFLVVDMVVASTLMSMGMLMLPPVLISLPFKLLLFVLVDGWNLVAKSLINGFAG